MESTYSSTFDKESTFESAFVALLKTCGWEKEVIEYPTEEDLIRNWADILFANNRDIDRLGDYPLTPSEMGDILNQIAELRTPYALNSFINGKEVLIKRDNPDDVLHCGKTVSLRIYDRHEIAGGHSRYQIVRQPKFKASQKLFPTRRGDVMLLINGMPVFHIELKKSGVPLSQAYNQIKHYSKEGIFSGIFSLIQIFIAMTPSDAVYFTNVGPDGVFNDSYFFHWADFDNIRVTEWQAFTKSVLYIPMAHELIGYYTVADKKDGLLKVLRSYQYWAVSKINNVVTTHKWIANNQRGGYIWHTTGSGKTLTSFKAADLIAKSQLADKVVFLFDRIELDTQSLKHYQNFADDADDVQGTSDTGVLISKLKDTTSSSNTLIVSSIQKMCRIYEDGSTRMEHDIALINKLRMVIIVDECHRDTFGDMMSKIKETFPRALFFGFTGTPIMDENKKKGCNSANVFGDELHRYTIGDGIRDKNVLAFDTYMVETYRAQEIKTTVALELVHAKSMEEMLADPKKKEAYYKLICSMKMAGHYDENGMYIKGFEDYLPLSQYTDTIKKKHYKAVVSDIVNNYYNRSCGKKFHSIFATSSIAEAIMYYRMLKKAAPSLVTTVLVDPSDNNGNTNYEKMEGLAEIIGDYNARYHLTYSIPTYGDMKKDISLRLSHEKPYVGIEKHPEQIIDMLIVVDQMLTGFDSKWVSVLYLDKVMRQQNIIQAFSRTNRIFGSDKPVGVIYYYRYPHTMLRNIEEAVKIYSGDKANMVFVDKLDKNIQKFENVYLEIKELFEDEGISYFAHLPTDVSARKKFAERFNLLNAILEMIKVQDFTWKKAAAGKYAISITEEIYYILLQRYKELFVHVPGDNPTEEPPYDLDTHIAEHSTGKIDAEYIDSRFARFIKLKHDEASQQLIDEALAQLFKSFALLSEEEQKFANVFIKDVQMGSVVLQEGKSFRDYITEYMKRAKDDQVHRFAQTFGLDETMLRELMLSDVTEETLNEFGRFNNLKASADLNKAKAYFEGKEGKALSQLSVLAKLNKLLKEFILQNGFDI